MTAPTYRLHHVCIYDGEPRTNMWTWLKWYHAIPQYYWGGEEFHLTDEGHVDYTFLACGSAFQVQLESPPFQFEYERNWAERHGSGLNHICWIVDNARASYDHLLASGCEPAQEYTEFGVYNGFVAMDPEGRWIEIMEYVGDFKTPDVEFRPFGIPGLQMFGVTQFTEDLVGQVDWYCRVMDLRPIHGSVESGVVYLADREYDAESRNVVMILAEPRTDAERTEYEKHGPIERTRTHSLLASVKSRRRRLIPARDSPRPSSGSRAATWCTCGRCLAHLPDLSAEQRSQRNSPQEH